MSGLDASPVRGRKENWLLEIGLANSTADACEQAEQIARSRGYEVVSAQAEVRTHTVDSLTRGSAGSFWVRLVVIER